MTRNCYNVMRKVASDEVHRLLAQHRPLPHRFENTPMLMTDDEASTYADHLNQLRYFLRNVKEEANQTAGAFGPFVRLAGKDPADIIKTNNRAFSDADNQLIGKLREMALGRVKDKLIATASTGLGGIAGAGIGAGIAGKGNRLLGGTIGGIAGLGAGYGLYRLGKHTARSMYV